jgi:rare lipoprotein A (peptidoglycan hydrolase)
MLRLNAAPSLAVCLIAADLLVWGGAAAFRWSTQAPAAVCAPVTADAAAAPRRSKPVAFVSGQKPGPSDALGGIASWYGQHWQGRETASGARFNWRKLTAAHRTLPLNTPVRVTNRENGRSVIVLINDRGPYIDGRVIDLSLAAAKQLGMVRQGLVPVCIELVDKA